MKFYILMFMISVMAIPDGLSQKKAVIKDTGEEVELLDDGTWQYVYDDPSGSIKNDTVIFDKPRESNSLVRSEKLDVGIWVNKKKWTYAKNKEGEITPSELTFKLMGEDAYAMLITEKIYMPIDNLLEIVFQNAQKAATEVEVTAKECRQVNGKIIHFMQMEGTIQGIKFVYLGYYYSDDNGSIQFLTYTSQNLLKQYKEEMENLLNGLVIN